MNLGRVVLDEVSCDIQQIRLEAGEIVFYATARGTYTVHEGADLAVFGPDGDLVLSRGPISGGDTIHTKDGLLTVRAPVLINDKRAT